MQRYKVIAPFKSGGTLIESGTWTPPSQAVAERLQAAGCIRPLKVREEAGPASEPPAAGDAEPGAGTADLAGDAEVAAGAGGEAGTSETTATSDTAAAPTPARRGKRK